MIRIAHQVRTRRITTESFRLFFVILVDPLPSTYTQQTLHPFIEISRRDKEPGTCGLGQRLQLNNSR